MLSNQKELDWWGMLHTQETWVACKVLVGDRWENLVVDGRINIKIDLEETVCRSMEWIYLVKITNNWWAVVNAEINHYIS